MTRALLIVLVATPFAGAADPAPNREYLDFVKRRATELRAKVSPPASLEAWALTKAELRRNLLAAWGGFPEKPPPLDPQNHGELKRDGYRVEKITFQTRPGIRMTANLYLPDKKGKLPTILMVHGHWPGAKQDPVVQSRCIGAVKLGYVVLSVDAFGAGERAIGTALGEYHGEMTAATLLPLGLPLSGLQVYENMRAVDYLITRPEVDADRIGITGASGGGNQTMYAGAFDERFKCVVPVCSVGNYQAYLGAACCLCEVVPGTLRFTEEGSILGLVAPRGLMVINATRDAVQFSVPEAKKSIAFAEPIFKLHGKPGNIRHAIFESPHDYSKAMREAMYGWMALHLKGEGDGSPIPEPEIKTEKPEDLRCFPGTTRPRDWITLPQFAAAEGRKLLAAKRPADPHVLREALEKSLGGFPKPEGEPKITAMPNGHGGTILQFESEPGIGLSSVVEPGEGPLVLVLNLEGGAKASTSEVAKAARDAKCTVAGVELRATGTRGIRETIGLAPDHNTAEWGLWIGRPLLGQWVTDVRRTLDALAKHNPKWVEDVILIGEGPAGLVALAAAATDKRITKVAAVGTLASFVSDVPYQGQRLGTIVPGILRDVGDVPHLAALVQATRLVIAGGVGGDGKPLSPPSLGSNYQDATAAWKTRGREKDFILMDEADAAKAAAALMR